MNMRHKLTGVVTALLALLAQAPAGFAQVPVDENGNVVGQAATAAPMTTDDDAIPLRSAGELEALVGPVALYPDDLLAIVLPAATYPLQVVQAARFLEDLEHDPSLQPDEDWDDSIVALVNYPEVVEMMNEDLDWTWQLGEAVVAQQSDVINAIAVFRDRAYAAGNLKSDDRQTVARNGEDIIEIAPVSEEVIYVPYYEPERVVVYQPRPVYYYYPRAYPVYYYPYPSYYAFSTGYFWGVTTAFSIGWNSWNLCTYHPTYYGHPYYGYNYRNSWWYRRPSVTVYNNYYVNNDVHVNYRSRHGDTWRPRASTRLRYSDQRITRNRHYPNPATTGTAYRESRSIQGAYARTPDKRAAAARTAPPSAASSGSRPQRGDGDSVQRMRSAIDAGTTSSRRTTSTRAREPATNMQEVRTALAANANRDRGYTTTRNPSQARPSVNERRSTVVTPDAARRTPAYSTTRPADSSRAGTSTRQLGTAPARRAPSATAPRPSAPVSRQPATTSRQSAPATRPSAPASRPSTASSRPAQRASSAGATRESRSSGSSGNRRSGNRTR